MMSAHHRDERATVATHGPKERRVVLLARNESDQEYGHEDKQEVGSDESNEGQVQLQQTSGELLQARPARKYQATRWQLDPRVDDGGTEQTQQRNY